jgi:predicted acyl esterase
MLVSVKPGQAQSSEGVATDEYPASEQADLCRVIGWLASQPWSTDR